jgi:phenylglyoxylate dehydrogenase epsilon subunit
MGKHKHLIIGCGSAALSALRQIRKVTSEDEIKIVTMEDHPPYSPMSLPYLISGRIKESDIQMIGDDYLDQMKATLIKGERVDSIDTQSKEVNYDNGESDIYDTLLIATGSEPVKPAIRGLDECGFLGFHTIEDCKKLLKELEGKTSVGVLGAGLVGMEVAIGLAERDYQVTIMEKEPRLLPLYFDEEAASLIRDIFLNQGIRIMTGKEVSEVNRKKGKVEISFSNGDPVNVDVLVTCVGVKPRTNFIKDAGIAVNNGILVDRRMMTNVKGIYAAGDVAEAPNFFTGSNGLNPILPSAVKQGKIAGSNMAGQEVEYEGWLPMNTFNFFGHLAISVGKFMPSRGDEVLFEKEHNKPHYKKLICRDDRLLGATFLDTDIDAGVFRYLIEKMVDIGAYKELLINLPRETSLWLMLEAERKETISLEA